MDELRFNTSMNNGWDSESDDFENREKFDEMYNVCVLEKQRKDRIERLKNQAIHTIAVRNIFN